MSAFTAQASSFKMIAMTTSLAKTNLYSALSGLVLLLGIIFLTNPNSSIAYTIIFFAALYVFIYNALLWLITAQFGQVNRSIRKKLTLVSTFIVILFMLISTKSLNWVDFMTLLLIGLGLYFYLARR